MEHKLSALIVDDEESARILLHKLLQETLYFGKIKCASSVSKALTELTQFEPDLIFLDIEMPEKDGFSVIHDLSRNRKRPAVVFVTAYDQYAIKAIKNGAFDYLLKPVNREELRQCIVKYSERLKENQNVFRHEKPADLQEKIPRITVTSRNGTLFINPSSILYCKAEGNYTSICTGEKKHLCSMNLGKVKELLPGKGFIRIGRSLIINFEYITLLDRKASTLILVRDNESVSVKVPKHYLKVIDMV
jgi:two-component system LytT family response regulator